MLYCRADKLAGGMDETKRRGSTRYIALNNREYLSKGSLLLRWPAEASEALDTTERVQDFLCWPSKLILHRRWNQYLVKKKMLTVRWYILFTANSIARTWNCVTVLSTVDQGAVLKMKTYETMVAPCSLLYWKLHSFIKSQPKPRI